MQWLSLIHISLPQEKLERSDAVRSLLAAMQTLEETDRAILQLQYGQGMTGAQIAAALGLHAATVRQRSRRARQKLKQDVYKRQSLRRLNPTPPPDISSPTPCAAGS